MGHPQSRCPRAPSRCRGGRCNQSPTRSIRCSGCHTPPQQSDRQRRVQPPEEIRQPPPEGRQRLTLPFNSPHPAGGPCTRLLKRAAPAVLHVLLSSQRQGRQNSRQCAHKAGDHARTPASRTTAQPTTTPQHRVQGRHVAPPFMKPWAARVYPKGPTSGNEIPMPATPHPAKPRKHALRIAADCYPSTPPCPLTFAPSSPRNCQNINDEAIVKSPSVRNVRWMPPIIPATCA